MEDFLDALRKHLSLFIATFGYAGLSPKAPGTMGSLAALPFAWFLWQQSPLVAWGIFLFTFLIGTWAAQEVVIRSGKEDNQKIVIDEVLGIFLTTSVVPASFLSLRETLCRVLFFVFCFAAFRFFDILKPGPVGWADRKIKGGLGVIVDDLVAGLLAAIAAFIFSYFLLTLWPIPILK